LLLLLATIGFKSAQAGSVGPEFISYPNIDGVFFADTSNEQGVCKALGFEMATPGSAHSTGHSADSLLVVDYNGDVSGGKNKWFDYTISQIICLNKIQREKFSVRKISHPVFSNMGISARSHQDGVCRLLGHDRGAPGSTFHSSVHNSEPLLTISESGNFIGEPYSQIYFKFTQIICIDYE